MKKEEYQKIILEIIVKMDIEHLKIIYEFLKGMGLGKWPSSFLLIYLQHFQVIPILFHPIQRELLLIFF